MIGPTPTKASARGTKKGANKKRGICAIIAAILWQDKNHGHASVAFIAVAISTGVAIAKWRFSSRRRQKGDRMKDWP
jgi:hypothetical protein